MRYSTLRYSRFFGFGFPGKSRYQNQKHCSRRQRNARLAPGCSTASSSSSWPLIAPTSSHHYSPLAFAFSAIINKKTEERASDSEISREMVDRDLMFGWRLYFGELDNEQANREATANGNEEERFESRTGRDTDMEYGWRLYFNELPVP